MLYKHLSVSVWNEERNEPDSYHVDCRIDGEMTFDQLMERVIKPAVHCAFNKLIPEMPHISSPPRALEIRDFHQWNKRYFGAPDA